jgi:uncharacterized protein with beta-barrel porin domain
MNRTKSILLAASALTMLTIPQLAHAQSVATGVTILSGPATPAANGEIVPDSVIIPNAISADGTTVLAQVIPAGNVGTPINNNIWTWVNGTPRMIAITRPTVPSVEQARQFTPTDLSGDGRTITGALSSRPTLLDGTTLQTLTVNRAVYWTQASGLTLFPDLSATEFAGIRGGNESAYVNNDGSLFAVSSSPIPYLPSGTRNPAPVLSKVYRYSPTGGYLSLGSLGATVSMTVSGINGAGDVIIGNSEDLAASNLDTNGDFINLGAFRWDAASGVTQLPVLSAAPQNGALGRYARAQDVSRDGSTIVGSSRGSDGRIQAVYWRTSGIQALGFVPGLDTATATTIATATSRNGSIIGGNGTGGPWLWESATGMQRLQTFVQNAGVALNGYTFSNLVDISDTGEFITGFATNPAGGVDSFGDPLVARGFVLQIARAAPTTLTTSARLIVTLTLPGVTQTSIVNQSFRTQVDGLLNGASVFTRTVTDPITGAGGVTALADARAALQVGGGLRRLVIGAPVLISNTTTVLNSTSNTVNVASGTQQTTAAVVTNGPATVATGDLGTCATPAANNTNPTGCSLPGTPVTVDAGILNSNVFTNTLNSVTPTTTPTVNQLITAKWQVSATAGNQFGTVHALVGPVAFETGNRLLAELLARGGAGDGSGSSGVAPNTAMHLGAQGSGLSMFGSYFGNRSSIDADTALAVAPVKGTIDGFVLGLEKELTSGMKIGAAVDSGKSNYTLNDPQYPESLSLSHTQLALYYSYRHGPLSLSAAGAYGFGNVNTALQSPGGASTASRNVSSFSLAAQVGYCVPLGKAAAVELVGGARQTSVKLNRFTETGGTSPLIGLDKTVRRTRLFAGAEFSGDIALGSDAKLTPRLYARYVRDSGDTSGVADVVFASAPGGPVLQAIGPSVGRTGAEIGGSVEAHFSKSVSIWAGYDGSFRSGAQSHAAKAGVTVAF